MEIDPIILDRVADAIENARCPDREGPYGLYDYSIYGCTDRAHRVRDFRDPNDANYGSAIFTSNDPAEARSKYEELTRRHVARAAIMAFSHMFETETHNASLEK